MRSPKTTADLAGLMDELIDYAHDVLVNGEETVRVDKETGETTVTRVKPGAAMLGQIRQLLKDQGIRD